MSDAQKTLFADVHKIFEITNHTLHLKTVRKDQPRSGYEAHEPGNLAQFPRLNKWGDDSIQDLRLAANDHADTDLRRRRAMSGSSTRHLRRELL